MFAHAPGNADRGEDLTKDCEKLHRAVSNSVRPVSMSKRRTYVKKIIYESSLIERTMAMSLYKRRPTTMNETAKRTQVTARTVAPSGLPESPGISWTGLAS